MSKKKHVETSEDLVRALDQLFDQVLMDVPEEVDEILREAGYDPDELGKEMAKFVRQVSLESPMDWRNKQKFIEEEKKQLNSVPQKPQLTRSQKEARLTALLSDQRLSMAFRNFRELSDHDLDSLLAQAEYLRSQQQEPRSGTKDREQ